MKKNLTFKIWISVLFRGIWQFICNIFSWKNKTPFWRVIGGLITLCLLTFTGLLVVACIDHYTRPYRVNYMGHYDPEISANLKFRNNGRNEGNSFIYDARTKKKLIKGIDWIAASIDGDSLIIVAKGGKRGFVNRFTGEISIPFKYDAAWSFTDGVAGVCEGDSVYFIDHSGKPINDKKFGRVRGYDNYAYHGNYAAIPLNKKYGLIDRKGDWAIFPEYDDLYAGAKNLWYAKSGDRYGVIDTKAQILIPLVHENVWIHSDGGITVADALDHSQSRYDYDGRLLDGFIFDDIYFMSYYLNEFDKEGNQKQGVDNMLKYSANEYYGLMSRDGQPITPPLYYQINCLTPGVYECRISHSTTDCILIDEKGKKINE